MQLLFGREWEIRAMNDLLHGVISGGAALLMALMPIA